jgi:hypothetical protein
VEIKLKAAKEKMQTQLQLLDSTRKELCKREFSSSVVKNCGFLARGGGGMEEEGWRPWRGGAGGGRGGTRPT